jgi:hypothetical protein
MVAVVVAAAVVIAFVEVLVAGILAMLAAEVPFFSAFYEGTVKMKIVLCRSPRYYQCCPFEKSAI